MKLTRTDWTILFTLLAATVALYAQAVRFEHVAFDDPEYVFRNDRVKAGLNGGNLLWSFTSFSAGNWHPLTWISHMLDVSLFGPSAAAMHAVNVLLHAANAALLYLALRALTGSSWRSALVAALFAFHPLHVESVAWIAERKDVLSTFFGLLALLAYARYARAPSAGAYLIVAAAFAMSLLAKSMLVTFPFLLLLLDYWPLERLRASGGNRASAMRLIVEKLPFLLLSIVTSILTVIAQRGPDAAVGIAPFSLRQRLGNAISSYVHYIADMFWPAKLGLGYPFPQDQSMPGVLAAAGVLAIVTVAVLLLRRRWPHLFVGWFWHVGMLVPVIGLVGVGPQARADRYTYVPLIGLFIMVVWSLPAMRGTLRVAACSVLWAGIFVALAAVTERQLGYWRNTEALSRRALDVSGPLPAVHLAWGRSLFERGDHRAAAEHFSESVRLRPDWFDPHFDLGNALARQGKYEAAADSFRNALGRAPQSAETHYNLGVQLARLGRYPEAEQCFRDALRLRPEMMQASENLNTVLRAQGKVR